MLEDRVAVITGGGRGLGREHALLFASLGARVVVNDLAAASDESDCNRSAAQAVVDEIEAMGGEAVANSDSVSDYFGGRSIVETAISTFGRLDIVVNNAGILRDRMISSMSEEEFDDVIAVHLKGTFNVVRHASEHWRERTKSGDLQRRSIVNTASGSGLRGVPGQVNYGAAKAGIATMTIVMAKELERYGVRTNCIAPIARTRLTLSTPGMGDVMSDAKFDPGNVSPLVAYLASERCVFNGQVFSVFGGTVGIYCPWSIHSMIHTEGRWDVSALTEAIERDLPHEVVGRTSGAFDDEHA
jgi:NAD(P)-dependent dehydrogenase (short-subunit alcohol dehydrogenase family)